jgi:hypothetical protein
MIKIKKSLNIVKLSTYAGDGKGEKNVKKQS